MIDPWLEHARAKANGATDEEAYRVLNAAKSALADERTRQRDEAMRRDREAELQRDRIRTEDRRRERERQRADSFEEMRDAFAADAVRRQAELREQSYEQRSRGRFVWTVYSEDRSLVRRTAGWLFGTSTGPDQVQLSFLVRDIHDEMIHKTNNGDGVLERYCDQFGVPRWRAIDHLKVALNSKELANLLASQPEPTYWANNSFQDQPVVGGPAAINMTPDVHIHVTHEEVGVAHEESEATSELDPSDFDATPTPEEARAQAGPYADAERAALIRAYLEAGKPTGLIADKLIAQGLSRADAYAEINAARGRVSGRGAVATRASRTRVNR